MTTTRISTQNPDIQTLNQSIKPHSDYCNFALTSHLGVDVPEGQVILLKSWGLEFWGFAYTSHIGVDVPEGQVILMKSSALSHQPRTLKNQFWLNLCREREEGAAQRGCAAV